MAQDGSPLKFIDIKRMLSQFGQQAVDGSLAMSGILPGQGQIPPASAEFMASNRNPFPNALAGPIQAMTGSSLAGTLRNAGDQLVTRPGHQAVEDRQSHGFFADIIRKRMEGAGL